MSILTAKIEITGPDSAEIRSLLGGITEYRNRSHARKAIHALFSKISSNGWEKMQGGLGVKKGATKAEIL